MNPRNTLATAAIALLFTASCRQGADKTDGAKESEASLSGRFVNQTFLSEMADSLGYTPRYFCFQMHFVEGGRVFIDRGFEGDTLQYTRDGDRFRLVGASSMGDMAFDVKDDSTTLVLVDSAFTGVARNSSFTRLPNGDDPAKAWVAMVNDRMVAGEYEIMQKGKPTAKKVRFHSDGSVSGLDGYTRYELCHTGDCLQTTQPYRHVMYLLKEDGSRTTLAFTIENSGTGLKVYGVGDPIEGTKGERKVLAMVYDLKKV